MYQKALALDQALGSKKGMASDYDNLGAYSAPNRPPVPRQTDQRFQATVADYVGHARLAALAWPLPEELDDGALERWLFP
jgi:hypothetical protein